MRRAAFIVALLVAAGARAQLVTPILNYTTTDAGGEYLGINPGPYSQTCAVCSVASTQDGGFWFGIGQVDPLNPSVPIGPQLDGGCGTPDGGATLCVNTLDGGSGAVVVPWSCDAGLCVGVTLSTVNSQAVIPGPTGPTGPAGADGGVGPAGPTGPTGPTGSFPVDGGLTIPFLDAGTIEANIGFYCAPGTSCCYWLPGGESICSDGTGDTVITSPDGGDLWAQGVKTDGGLYASGLGQFDAGVVTPTVNATQVNAGGLDAGSGWVVGAFSVGGILNALTSVLTPWVAAGAIDAGSINAATETVGFLDAGQIDTGLLVAGAIDAGVIADVRETSGFVDAGQIDATLLVCGAIDAGVVVATFESLGLLDAGEICLQGVCETTWPSGGGGVYSDGGAGGQIAYFTSANTIASSAYATLGASGAITAAAVGSPLFLASGSTGTFECDNTSDPGCLQFDNTGNTALGEVGTQIVLTVPDGGALVLAAPRGSTCIFQGQTLDGGNIVAISSNGTYTIDGGSTAANASFSNNADQFAQIQGQYGGIIANSSGTTLLECNSAANDCSVWSSLIVAGNETVQGASGVNLTGAAAGVSLVNDAGIFPGTNPGQVAVYGPGGVEDVQFGIFPGNTAYWAIFPGGVVPDDYNFAFLGNLSGSDVQLNSTNTVILGINNVDIVTATSAGVAITGTESVSGLSTLTGGVEINSANTVFWLNDAGVGPGNAPGLIAIQGADTATNVAFMGNIQNSGVPTLNGFAIYPPAVSGEPGLANFAFETSDAGQVTAINGSSSSCLDVSATPGFCCNSTNCVAGAVSGTPGLGIAAQSYSATPASGAGYQAGGVTYVNGSTVAGTLYVWEVSTGVACSGTGTAVTLHFSSGTPACTCTTVSNGTAIATNGCFLHAAATATSVTVESDVTTDCSSYTVMCLGLH